MTSTRLLLFVFALLLAWLPAAPLVHAQDDQEVRQELQERFKERLPVMRQLKKVEKIGETTEGLIAAVRPEYQDDVVEVQREGQDEPERMTIRAFIAAENADRQRLYQLIAEELETTPDKVATRNAKRNFENAAPEEYLRTAKGEWIQKKDVK